MRQKSPLLLLLIVVACARQPKTPEEELYALMEGTFVSEEQSKKDPEYYNITLSLAHIWKDREGHWIYAEYGITNNPQQPYDQRIYKILKNSESVITMESYELREPQQFVGKWDDPEAFDALKESELLQRKGCQVYFEKKEEVYLGKTAGKTCSRSLGTASYAKHLLRIEDDKIINWAQGFDANDSLVWGKSDGGYILDKISNR